MGMTAILIYGPWPFVQMFNTPLTEGSTCSLKKFFRGVSEMSFVISALKIKTKAVFYRCD